MTFPTGFKFSYSGDCRPSKTFAEIGKGSTVLLHEATFDDEMHRDADAKKHSTTSEAIGVGLAMEARRILLTHFSQRYQKIPVMSDIDKLDVKLEEEIDAVDDIDETALDTAVNETGTEMSLDTAVNENGAGMSLDTASDQIGTKAALDTALNAPDTESSLNTASNEPRIEKVHNTALNEPETETARDIASNDTGTKDALDEALIEAEIETAMGSASNKTGIETAELDASIARSFTDANADWQTSEAESELLKTKQGTNFTPVKQALPTDLKVGFAFDYMCVRVGDIIHLEKFTPALLKLYEEEERRKQEEAELRKKEEAELRKKEEALKIKNEGGGQNLLAGENGVLKSGKKAAKKLAKKAERQAKIERNCVDAHTKSKRGDGDLHAISVSTGSGVPAKPPLAEAEGAPQPISPSLENASLPTEGEAGAKPPQQDHTPVQAQSDEIHRDLTIPYDLPSAPGTPAPIPLSPPDMASLDQAVRLSPQQGTAPP
jgi:hypothetical protein